MKIHLPRVVVQRIGMGHRGTSVLVRGGQDRSSDATERFVDATQQARMLDKE